MLSPMQRAAQTIANQAARAINQAAQDMIMLDQEPLIKYKAQGLLEEVIKCLEEKV